MEGEIYKQKIIMSVGGSLIVPDGGIDTDFLSQLNTFIRTQLAKHTDRQFFLVSGGGRTTRHYQEAAKTVIGHDLPDIDIDWLGLHATRLNGHLLRTIFYDVAHPRIVENYDRKLENLHERVVIAAGWKPGFSTDYCAVQLAGDYAVSLIINMSNITKVYNKDPKKHPDATPLDTLSWLAYRKLVGDTWIPGLNSPFDPIASKRAQELKLKVIVLNGNDFKNIERCIDEKQFIGTVIE